MLALKIRRIQKLVRCYPCLTWLFLVLLFSVINSIRLWNVDSFHHLKESEILTTLHSCPSDKTTISEMCPKMAHVLDYSQNVQTVLNDSFYDNMVEILQINPGGMWSPVNCIAWQRVAIIVPYRDRLYQLKLFLQHLHPFLQSQQLDYVIVVVEQTPQRHFNRGMLFNVGFAETSKDLSFCCFIFHDVDLFPESLNNIYACTHHPRHMCSSINTFRYVLPYPEIFGGVVAFTRKQFQHINGYSNLYFGWGGEDDDLYNRVLNTGLKIERWDKKLSHYKMLSHAKAAPNPSRFTLLSSAKHRMKMDGLNSLSYEVQKYTLRPLFTHILVNI